MSSGESTQNITPTELKIEEAKAENIKVAEVKIEDLEPEEEEKELTYPEHVTMIYASIVKAAEIKGGLTMKDCRQIRDAQEVLIDYFTPDESDAVGAALPEVTRLETDALALLIKIVETQQLTGIFSIEGSIKLEESIDVLSGVLTKKKASARKMEVARRKLKNTDRRTAAKK